MVMSDSDSSTCNSSSIHSSNEKLFGSTSETSSGLIYQNPICYDPFQLVFAHWTDQGMYPAAVLGNGIHLTNGINVYFFHTKINRDVTKDKVLYKLHYLLDHNVSFNQEGVKKGRVIEIIIDRKTTIPVFKIQVRLKIYTVTFFKVFLTKPQAFRIYNEVVENLKCFSKGRFNNSICKK